MRRAAVGGESQPELHRSRLALPEWDLEREELGRVMATVAALAREPRLADVAPEELAFLDLETTGLSLGAGTLAFLVGVARLERGADGMALVVDQWLMRAVAHERRVLEAATACLRTARGLVTFNGKSYDVPLLEGRLVLSRLPPLRRPPHFDALHPARRLLAHELGDVRLTTLERALWGRQREDDLPGAAVPQAFFAALRGDDELLPAVLRHNADDLVTLARLPPLLASLAAGGRTPTGLGADRLAVAELELRRGRREAALLALGAGPPADGAEGRRGLRQARLAARAGGPEAARDCWMRLCGDPELGPEPHERLAVILEHHDRDPEAALELIGRALARFGSDPEAARRLGWRAQRLRRKLGARAGSLPAGQPGRLPATAKEQERWRSSPWGTA